MPQRGVPCGGGGGLSSLELLELLLVCGFVLLLEVELGLLELLDWLLLPLPAALALRMLPLELDCVPVSDDDEELFDVMPGGELSGLGFSGDVDGYVPDGEFGCGLEGDDDGELGELEEGELLDG